MNLGEVLSEILSKAGFRILLNVEQNKQGLDELIYSHKSFESLIIDQSAQKVMEKTLYKLWM